MNKKSETRDWQATCPGLLKSVLISHFHLDYYSICQLERKGRQYQRSHTGKFWKLNLPRFIWCPHRPNLVNPLIFWIIVHFEFLNKTVKCLDVVALRHSRRWNRKCCTSTSMPKCIEIQEEKHGSPGLWGQMLCCPLRWKLLHKIKIST